MRPTIALIDADANARHSLSVLLATLDANVAAYESAERFLEANASATCVIAELQLPGLSGLELLRRIRAGGDHTPRNTPVILLSDESDVRTAVEAMRMGATDFIERPQLDVKLLRRVSQLLNNEPSKSHSRDMH